MKTIDLAARLQDAGADADADQKGSVLDLFEILAALQPDQLFSSRVQFWV